MKKKDKIFAGKKMSRKVFLKYLAGIGGDPYSFTMQATEIPF